MASKTADTDGPADGSDEGAVDEPAYADEIAESDWRGHTKFQCTLCTHQQFHALDNRAAVEDHIEQNH